MKLSEELKRCGDGKTCGECRYWEEDTKVTCTGLLQAAYERIESYEKLEEQCMKENSWCLRMLLEKWKEFFEDIQELYRYRDLKKQNRLPELPCAVGDMVYRINKGARNPIIPMVVTEIRYKAVSDSKTVIKLIVSDDAAAGINGSSVYHMEEAGRKFFLTWEEAEAALKEMKERE